MIDYLRLPLSNAVFERLAVPYRGSGPDLFGPCGQYPHPHGPNQRPALLRQLHFLDQRIGAVDLIHYPQHVAAVDVDGAGGAGVEVPVGVD